MTRVFDEDALLHASTLQVPEGGFGSEDFRPGLDALLRALEDEAQLDPGTVDCGRPDHRGAQPPAPTVGPPVT